MVRRFTVIQGGRSEWPDRAAAPDSEAAPHSETWRVDLHRPGTVDAGAVSAWRALLVRNAVDDPLRDPDHLLPLAQHRPGGRPVAVALAWSQDRGTGRDTLRGVVPLAMPCSILGGRTRRWQPGGTEAAGLVERAAAEAVDRALRARLGALRRPIRLVGEAAPVSEAKLRRPPLTARRSAPPRSVPAGNLIGIRPEGWEAAESEILAVTDPAAVRDAVETFLALDARTSARPIIADPAEASLVRVVTRLFARRGALRVEVLRRAGAVVAGTLHLCAGSASVVWRRAQA